MVFAGILIMANGAILKWVTTDYPAGQIIFTRSVFIWFPLAYLIARSGGFRTVRFSRPKFHIIRGCCVIASAFLYVIGLRYLPLADMTAITFSAPIFITVLAPYLLGESVGWRRWSAVIVGFMGIVIIARPTGEGLAVAAVFPLGMAFWAAIRDIITRRMTETESSNAILFSTTAIVMVAGLLTAPFGWKPPTIQDFALMAGAGLFAGFGHHFMIEAFRNAKAVMLAPFRYLAIVWAAALGYAIWGDLPDGWAFFGIGLVIMSGLYIFQREIKLRRAARVAE